MKDSRGLARAGQPPPELRPAGPARLAGALSQRPRVQKKAGAIAVGGKNTHPRRVLMRSVRPTERDTPKKRRTVCARARAERGRGWGRVGPSVGSAGTRRSGRRRRSRFFVGGTPCNGSSSSSSGARRELCAGLPRHRARGRCALFAPEGRTQPAAPGRQRGGARLLCYGFGGVSEENSGRFRG